MKKFLLFTLFFLLCISLFGQSIPAAHAPDEDRFFIPAIRGDGSASDKAWFYDRLHYELIFQKYAVGSRRSDSNYTIRGTLNRTETGSSQSALSEDNEFIIELIRNRTNEILIEKQLFYNIIDESTALEISWIIYEMLNNIPESGRKDRRARDDDDDFVEINIPHERERPDRVRSEDWRDKVFFFEYSLLWAPRENFIKEENNYLNLGANLAVEMQILDFFAIDTGVQVVQEISAGEDYRDLLAEYFISLKIVLKPFKNFMIEPYGGLSINFYSTLDKVEPSMNSYFIGLELCIKTKSGILVIDPRIAFDMDYSRFIDPKGIGPVFEHKRRMLQIGIGYKTGFISKLVNVSE